MSWLNRRLSALFLALALVPFSSAEEISLPIASDIRGLNDLYTAEILIFEQVNARTGEEVWPQDLPPPNMTGARFPTAHNGAPISLGEALTRSSFALNGEANRLARQGYKVLYHTSWMQQFSPNTEMRLRVADAQGALEGSIRIERKRFLHVYPDINYDLAIRPEQVAPKVRLNETRRMRSSELHYIDHPVLGMLVLFRPVKPG